MELEEAVERFVDAADRGDADALAATYSPDFLNVRIADDGGEAWLTGPQILSILRVSENGNHSVPARDTVIHRAEIVGDSGYVLMSRMKDLGRGWEPAFYNLIWKRASGKWLLLREFVHQKIFPHFKKS